MPNFIRIFALSAFFLLTQGACISQFSEAHPSQPIDFSHKVHAGDNQIPCMYCHQNADKSIAATVPSVSTCMNCHSKDRNLILGEGLAADRKAELDKLYGYWEAKQQIPWNKVHDEPDFVYFPHKRHVKYFMDCAKETKDFSKCSYNPNQNFTEAVDEINFDTQAQRFTCSQCHGPVWTFGTGQRVEELNMGWCVSCHKNRIASAPVEERDVLHSRMLDCWTCHK